MFRAELIGIGGAWCGNDHALTCKRWKDHQVSDINTRCLPTLEMRGANSLQTLFLLL
jgi:hypothetical protein